MMAQSPRKNLKTRSTTSSRSSETQTESPQNDSQTSTEESDETSTQKGTETDTSSSTPSEDEENDALFADADADAPSAPESDEDDEDEEEDAKGDSNVLTLSPTATNPEGDAFTTDRTGNVISEYGVVATGAVHTFEVKDDRGDYTFKGHVQNNIIIVAEPCFRELQLPGTKRTTKVLVHHKGQTLARRSFERFATEKIQEG